LDFRPDPGRRVMNASLPRPDVDAAGPVHLYYQDETVMPSREMVAVSPDGLAFPGGAPPVDHNSDPRRLRLPNGAWRIYPYDPRLAELHSQVSNDGLLFTPEPGVRYSP